MYLTWSNMSRPSSIKSCLTVEQVKAGPGRLRKRNVTSPPEKERVGCGCGTRKVTDAQLQTINIWSVLTPQMLSLAEQQPSLVKAGSAESTLTLTDEQSYRLIHHTSVARHDSWLRIHIVPVLYIPYLSVFSFSKPSHLNIAESQFLPLYTVSSSRLAKTCRGECAAHPEFDRAFSNCSSNEHSKHHFQSPKTRIRSEGKGRIS
jgi:hypothetical protein